MKIGNKEFDTAKHTYIMGILNVTPDSFSDGGKWNGYDAAMRHAEELLEGGTDILDIGGVFARRLQLQEQMTAQIADALMENLHPKGVMVLAEAEHMCMTMRGIKKPGSKTVSVVTRGAFEENEKLQNMFFRMIG